MGTAASNEASAIEGSSTRSAPLSVGGNYASSSSSSSSASQQQEAPPPPPPRATPTAPDMAIVMEISASQQQDAPPPPPPRATPTAPDMAIVMEMLNTVHELEAQHKFKLAAVIAGKQALRDFEDKAMEAVAAQEKDRKEESESLEEINQKLYDAKMADLKAFHEAELEALMHHVSTKVLEERRAMQQEDALAFIHRELMLELTRERAKATKVHQAEMEFTAKQIRSTHNKKLLEIIRNFNAELLEAQAKVSAGKQAERDNRKRGASLWDIFSPSKRARAGSSGGSGSEEEDEDDSD